MRRRALACVLLTGCGRLGFAHVVEGDADARIDAAPDSMAPRCDPTAPFGTPVLIAELSTATLDGTLRLLDDERGYFWSARLGSKDIYFAARPSPDAPFEITPVLGINTDGTDESDPTVTSDGTFLVFRRNTPGIGDEIWTAVRGGTQTEFTDAMRSTLDSPSIDAQPFLQPEGNEIYFQSSRGGNPDVWRARRTGTTFSPPSRVTEIASTSDEGDPVISRDGLTLYFRSNRVTAGAPGDFNIYVATRTPSDTTFGAPMLVPGVNSDAADGPSALSSDDCQLYLSSDRAGSNDVYVATRGAP